MKSSIHPTFYEDTQVVCSSCSNSFTTGSTKKSITVEVCYKCHPLYTGEQRFIDTKGKVDRFEKKRSFAQKYHVKKSGKKFKKGQKEEKQLKSLKQLLGEI